MSPGQTRGRGADWRLPRGPFSRAILLGLVVTVLAVGASAQSYVSFTSFEECVAGYVKQFNLTDVDAKAKCSPLFPSPPPSPSPVPLPSPSLAPTPSVELCIAQVMKEKGLPYEEAKRACLSLASGSPPSADPLLTCIERTQAARGLSYEEAKKLCVGGFPSPAPDPTMECIARLQKEKGLSYDEAKRTCLGLPPPPSPETGTNALMICIEQHMVKGASQDEARRACASMAATTVVRASTFEECVRAAMEKQGMGKEEAAKACGASRGMDAPSAPSAVNMGGCVEKHVQGGLSKEEAAKTCATMVRGAEASPAPRRVAREIVERLKERLHAARAVPESMRSCMKDAQGAMEKCTDAGKSAGECHAEVARQMKEGCSGPTLPEAGGSACAAKCADAGRACLASKSEEVCRKEGLACLSGCPEAVGRLATLAMKAERFHGLRVNPKEATARDENQNPVEVLQGAMEVKKAAAPPAEAPAPPAGAPAAAPAAPGGPPPRELILSLPMRLAAGKRLASFQHEASGIALEKDELSIPMRAGAEIAAHIRAKVREAVGRGNTAEMVVEKMKMETKAYEADFSAERPTVGRVLAKLAADLKDMPENAEVKVTPLAVLAEEKRKAVEEEVKRQGLRVKEVAYAMEVEHKNLASTVEKANVTMTVARKWVEAQGGPELVRIHREADDGRRELLETVFLGYDNDTAIFEGRSPGLSVFSLVAVEEETPSPSPTPKPKQPGFDAVLGAAALLAAGLWARRNRS